MTGISGGGAATFWIAAADERVKVAVPVSGMSDLESYVTNKVINGHCDCMFLVQHLPVGVDDDRRPASPRGRCCSPTATTTASSRWTATAASSSGCASATSMLGKPELVDEYVTKGGHDYRPDLRVAIFEFINKHLKSDTAPGRRTPTSRRSTGKELRVFPTDEGPAEGRDQRRGRRDVRAEGGGEAAGEAEEFKEWKAGLVKQLREKSFRALPEKVPAAACSSRKRDSRSITGDGNRVRFGSDLATLRRSVGTSRCGPESGRGPDQAESTLGGRSPKDTSSAIVITRGRVRAGGPRKNPPNTVERSLVLLGQTADSGRVRDVAAFLRRSWPIGRTTSDFRRFGSAAGKPASSPPTPLCSLRIVIEVVIADPPTSHRDGPHFLNVLRVLDIPEALGLLAPDVKLTLIGKNAKDKAFDKTAAIYKLAGAEDKFRRSRPRPERSDATSPVTPLPASSHFPFSLKFPCGVRGGISPATNQGQFHGGNRHDADDDLRAALGALSRPRWGGRRRLRLRHHGASGSPPRPPRPRPPDKGVVACIYGNVPVTREELGEFLIARGGYEKVELVVNKTDHRGRGGPAEHHGDAEEIRGGLERGHPRPGHHIGRLQEARPAAVRQDALRVDRGRHQAAASCSARCAAIG